MAPAISFMSAHRADKVSASGHGSTSGSGSHSDGDSGIRRDRQSSRGWVSLPGKAQEISPR